MGAIDLPGLKEKQAEEVSDKVKERFLTIGTMPPGLVSTETKNQRRTARCTSFAIAKVVEIMATRRLKKKVFVNPEEIWWLQLKTGADEKVGDSLQNALRQVKEYGVSFNDYDAISGKYCLRKIVFGGYARVMPKDFQKWLDDGHPIFTGCTVYDDFIVNDYIDFNGKKQGGHAFVIVGHNKDDYRIENSWGDKWGIDGTCMLAGDDTKRLMSAYILHSMMIIDC